eukprot:2079841-Prymnesium_polylepis.1
MSHRRACRLPQPQRQAGRCTRSRSGAAAQTLREDAPPLPTRLDGEPSSCSRALICPLNRV